MIKFWERKDIVDQETVRRRWCCRRCWWCCSSPRRRAWRPSMRSTAIRWTFLLFYILALFFKNDSVLVFRCQSQTLKIIFPGLPWGGSYSRPNICHVNLRGLARGWYPVSSLHTSFNLSKINFRFSLMVDLHWCNFTGGISQNIFFATKAEVSSAAWSECRSSYIHVCFLCKFSWCIAHHLSLQDN